MELKDFLKSELRKMFFALDDIEISYEQKSSSGCHIVEIKPISIYSDSSDYMAMEEEIEEKFESLFPSEEIMFVSTDSLTRVENPEWVFKMKVDYSKITFSTNDLHINDCLSNDNEVESNLCFAA